MIRISFRQSMLAGFLLIALLLSWAAISSWLTFERFAAQSRRGSEHALQLSASVQELADRTVDLERSARQFMLLDDVLLLERFDANIAHALAAVKRLEAIPGKALGKLAGDWRQAVAELDQALRQATPRTELQPFLGRLAELNGALAHGRQQWIDGENAALLVELEQSREQLTWLVAVAVVGAFLVALAMNWWLSRPIGSIERAIERLGESRFDAPVTVRGPADLRRVGRRLDWLRRRLGELEADRERSLRHVSHELKTPLTALREGIALLQEQVPGPLDGAQQEVVDILQDNVMALQRDIESLLRLNAASFAARRACDRPLALRQLLADVVHGRELQIKARRLTVLCQAPSITRVLDAEKLLVALDNLLSNAIDFSPEGGVVELHAEAIGNSLRFACIDHGPGVANEDRERIFEPFVQGSRASPTPRQGSGVGLSIVRELSTAMGGQVTLLPGDAQAPGAHFRIEVPSE
jgi:two-component system sensor histidine kinase GlrK